MAVQSQCRRDRRRRARWPAAVACLALASFAAAAAAAPDFAALAARAAPAVVNISVDRSTGPGFPPPVGPGADADDSPAAMGSGIIVASSGYILTSAHVIEQASAIEVKLADGRRFSAQLVGADRASDLALLKIAASDLPAAHFGDAGSLKPGQWVVAIGSPFGLENTVTAGVVSALHRHLASEPYISFIQTDVPINPGSSGGPLLNLDGEVVGINSEIYSRTGDYMGVSFAVPISLALNVVRQLKASGAVSRGWLGVNVRQVSPALADTMGMGVARGALVTRVSDTSPAARSGLQVGDIIVGFANQPIRDPADLPPLVGATPAGKQTSLTVLRQGERKRLPIEIGQLERDRDEGAFAMSGPERLDRLGMGIQALSAEQRQRLGVTSGVLVEYVGTGPAKDAGLLPGDVILRIGPSAVHSPVQLARFERHYKPRAIVPLLVLHKQISNFVAVTMPAAR